MVTKTVVIRSEVSFFYCEIRHRYSGLYCAKVILDLIAEILEELMHLVSNVPLGQYRTIKFKTF